MARLLALCAVVLLTACGASTSGSDSKLHVADSSERLMLLLHENGVEVTTTRNQKPAPLGKAWHAFERFAALPVADAVDDAFLFQATVQYSGAAWGRTFILDFGRQYAPKGGGDIQQVHLIAYFRARVFDEIRSQIRVVSCADELTSTPTPSCDGLCTYAGQSTAMLGSPCSIVPSVMAGKPGRSLEGLVVWSYQTGGDSSDAQHATWLDSVDASLVLQRALRSNALLGYQIYQGSVE